MVTDYKQMIKDLKTRLNKLYPTATIEQDIDDSGNAIWKTTIPGVQVIESMNVNALAIVVENFEARRRAQQRGE